MGSHRIEIAHATALTGIFLLVLSTQTLSGIDHASRGLVTERAMVVSAHPLASEVGVEIMKRGGNAIEPGKRMLSSMTPTILEKE